MGQRQTDSGNLLDEIMNVNKVGATLSSILFQGKTVINDATESLPLTPIYFLRPDKIATIWDLRVQHMAEINDSASWKQPI